MWSLLKMFYKRASVPEAAQAGFEETVVCWLSCVSDEGENSNINLLKPTGYVMHQQFNIQQLYVLPTLYLCVLYLFENKR